MLTVGSLCLAGGSKACSLYCSCQAEGGAPEVQDVSSGWWKDQEGERVQVQLKRG